MNIWCPICTSSSPESQEHLREIARLGVARFLAIARKAGVDITMEQQRDIYEALLTWENTLVPGEVDWLVHEHAGRAIFCCDLSEDVEKELVAVMDSMPAWNANYYVEDSWNISEERRVADRLEPSLRSTDERQ